MSKFKVGDRVNLIKKDVYRFGYDLGFCNCAADKIVLTVIGVDPDDASYEVDDNPESDYGYWVGEEDIESCFEEGVINENLVNAIRAHSHLVRGDTATGLFEGVEFNRLSFDEVEDWPELEDVVNHPNHYQGKVECIDAIESAVAGKTGLTAVCAANIIKYVWRCERKSGVEDLRKARWYLDKLISHLEEQQ
jgi:hypothetical protein